MALNQMPTSLAEAYQILQDCPMIPFAGGTDLMVQKRSWSETLPKTDHPFLFLASIKELALIREDMTDLAIGAMVSLETILNHPKTPKILKRMIAEMASPGIRHQATLAGNIGNASPAGDALLALYLLDALVVLGSASKERIVPIESFITSPRQTLRKPDEIIIEIRIPTRDFSGMVLKKVGTRKSDAIAKLSFGGLYQLHGNEIQEIRLAFGAVGPTVIRDKEMETFVCQFAKANLLSHLPRIMEHYANLIRPIDDQRSTKSYRKETALACLKAFFEEINEVIHK